MLEAVTRSGDPLLLAYRDNILLRQTVTPLYQRLAPRQTLLVLPYLGDPAVLAAALLLLPWLVVAWRRHSGAGQAYPAAAGLSDAGGAVFSCSPGKRGVYITPGTPALALLTAPFIGTLLVRVWRGDYWPGSAGCWEGRAGGGSGAGM